MQSPNIYYNKIFLSQTNLNKDFSDVQHVNFSRHSGESWHVCVCVCNFLYVTHANLNADLEISERCHSYYTIYENLDGDYHISRENKRK